MTRGLNYVKESGVAVHEQNKSKIRRSNLGAMNDVRTTQNLFEALDPENGTKRMCFGNVHGFSFAGDMMLTRDDVENGWAGFQFKFERSHKLLVSNVGRAGPKGNLIAQGSGSITRSGQTYLEIKTLEDFRKCIGVITKGDVMIESIEMQNAAFTGQSYTMSSSARFSESEQVSSDRPHSGRLEPKCFLNTTQERDGKRDKIEDDANNQGRKTSASSPDVIKLVAQVKDLYTECQECRKSIIEERANLHDKMLAKGSAAVSDLTSKSKASNSKFLQELQALYNTKLTEFETTVKILKKISPGTVKSLQDGLRFELRSGKYAIFHDTNPDENHLNVNQRDGVTEESIVSGEIDSIPDYDSTTTSISKDTSEQTISQASSIDHALCDPTAHIFLERQNVDSQGVADRRCLRHALNNYMGKAQFTDKDLTKAGQATNALQESLLENESVGSDWADGEQNWSYQVLCQVGKRHLGIQFESLQAIQGQGITISCINRFIVQRSDHWVAIVKHGGAYFDLNSLASKPTLIGKTFADVRNYLPTNAMIYAAWPEPVYEQPENPIPFEDNKRAIALRVTESKQSSNSSSAKKQHEKQKKKASQAIDENGSVYYDLQFF